MLNIVTDSGSKNLNFNGPLSEIYRCARQPAELHKALPGNNQKKIKVIRTEEMILPASYLLLPLTRRNKPMKNILSVNKYLFLGVHALFLVIISAVICNSGSLLIKNEEAMEQIAEMERIFSIDSIEKRNVRIIDEKGQPLTVPVFLFPFPVQEGDAIRMTFLLDQELKAEKLEKILELQCSGTSPPGPLSMAGEGE